MSVEYFLLRLALLDAIASKTALNLLLLSQATVALPVQRRDPLLDLLPFTRRFLEFFDDGLEGRRSIVEDVAEFSVRCVRQLRCPLRSRGCFGQPFRLIRHIAQRLILDRLSNLELRWICRPVCPDQAIVVQTIFHEGATRLVELSNGVGQPYRPVPSDDKSQRVGIIGSEKRRKSARLRRSPQRVKFVQTHQGRTTELASSILEKCRRATDVGSVDEHGFPVSAKESLGRCCPSYVGDLDQIVENSGGH